MAVLGVNSLVVYYGNADHHHTIKLVDIHDNYNSIWCVILTWLLFVVVNMLIDI